MTMRAPKINTSLSRQIACHACGRQSEREAEGWFPLPVNWWKLDILYSRIGAVDDPQMQAPFVFCSLECIAEWLRQKGY